VNTSNKTIVTLAMVVCGCLLPACGPTDGRIEAKRKFEAELADRQQRQAQSLTEYRLAAQAYEDDDLKSAREHATAALDASDRNAEAWMLMGLIEYKEDRVFDAASCFHRASFLVPDRFEPPYNIGILLESAGRYKQAIESYQAALKLSPNQLEVMENLARCYIRSNTDLDHAKELIDRALLTEQRPQWRLWLLDQSHRLATRKEASP